MTPTVAAEALRLAVGEPCRGLRRVASGRSSSAWAASSASGQWIVRVPVPDSGRTHSYRSEAQIGELLHERGHPVARWAVVQVDGVPCSVARRLQGRPVGYDERFQAGFAAALARLLLDLHHLDATGYGPLVDDDRTLYGRSSSVGTGVMDRWFHASIWPFDDSELASHVISDIAPELVEKVEQLRPWIIAAADEQIGVVHSDLHREHLLQDEAGGLAAVLDFGDAFRGSVAWDFALLDWYYGDHNASRVAARYPVSADIQTSAAHLAVAVGLYKLAKSPADPAVPERLRRVLGAVA